MRISNELYKAYVEDTTALMNETDRILKRRNSIGSLDSDSVDALFRIFHTIKASAAVIEDTKAVDIAYKVENIMSYLRKHGADSLPAAKVFSVLFDTEYFFRSNLGSFAAEHHLNDDSEFNDTLSSLVDEIDFSENSPTEAMVAFEELRPVLENVVSDMCKEFGKEAVLEFHGKELLLERSFFSRLSGPLTQIVRNAVDHGIETPDERERLGKPREGHITVNYGLENGVLFITVFNDGEKLHLKQILRKADELHILKKPRDQYKPDEIAALIMERGFTTTQHVGKWSGRGVGMDIIKSTVKDLGGKVMVSSGETSGFSMTLSFPVDEKNVKAGNKDG